MPHINLLPWREELRKRRQKEFAIVAVAAMALMGGVVAIVHLHFQQRIDFQGRRNAFLEQQIASLDKKIEEIKNLDREKARLLARMKIIQQLQTSRPEIVHVVDDIVRTIPEGVFYKKIEQSGYTFKMEGVAQSNARVSSLMRQLEASEWFENPRLIEIKAETVTPGGPIDVKLSNFTLNITQSQKKKADEEDGGTRS